MDHDYDFMKIALYEAQIAYAKGEVPVGAVLVIEGTIISKSHNQKETLSDPTAHAEILVIRESSHLLKNWRLEKATLYVTKEPCIMCAGAMINARIKRLVYGCSDPKNGAIESLYKIGSDYRLNHQIEITSSIYEYECKEILKSFFCNIRSFKK
ncbi:MAG: tRNA adenosine(34) deaminase TadA [Thermodesulfovibrionales bacterium]|nr:tRNA adenosine(34) deaminase TadA [Thermodesulfovibrionales bacterium]